MKRLFDNSKIDLRTAVSFRSAFLFPLQSPSARRELLIGALWLVVPIIGWLMNMGHRISMVHRMQHAHSAWPSWTSPRQLLRDGCLTFLGMLLYATPSLIMLLVWFFLCRETAIFVVAVLLFLLAVFLIPGFMTHYCLRRDARELFQIRSTLQRIASVQKDYLRAWAIALSAMGFSFLGIAFLGVGFLITSVWFWQVAGFSFARVFTRAFALDE